MTNNKNDKIFISGLESVRGISACLIVYFHVWALCGFAGGSVVLDSIVSNFDSSVRMFFLLSGFALLCGYEKSLFSSEVSLKNFYIKRFFKIAPVFYLVVIIQVLISYFFQNHLYSITSIIMSATLLFGFLPVNQELIVWASWAVGIECIFYLVFPLFVLIAKNKYYLIVSLILSLIITYNYSSLIGNGIPNSHMNILIYLSYFFMGGVLYRIIPLISKIKKGKAWNIIEIPFLITSLMLGILITKLFSRDIGMLIAFSLIICGAIYGYSCIIENKITRFLGSISYPMYLLHMIVVQVLSKFGVIQAISRCISNVYIRYVVVGTLVVLFTCILAHFVTRYVERYWVEKGKRYLKRI
ncbi:acyltransferase family protein [Clostridium puniceum]|uniref:Acyltransferase family protein n=1 Tax=Clostridium puniceum TaxID=29367 RepID=A0A1S8TG06_9CLOT|nr:acyltransferase [Clostridium puniceum]OOM76325.1 acyltransferase family protein [Clostridium puniceum]